MKVKELLMLCSEMGNLTFPADNEIDTELNTAGSCIRQLLVCCNCILEELYRDYASALRKTVVEVVDGFADTSAFKLSKVISLVDGEGNDVNYRYTEGGLAVSQDGKYNLCYARLPDEVGIDDELTLPTPRITERILAYGVLREYFAIIGDRQTSSQWEERYKDALRIADVKSSPMRMPVGRWL